jgi:hypothetical protein
MQSNSLEHPAQGIGGVDIPRASLASDQGKLISEDTEKWGNMIRATHMKARRWRCCDAHPMSEMVG